MEATSVLIEQIQADVRLQRLRSPSLPEVILKIRVAIEDEQRGLGHVARLIQAEPGLAARLIKIANSPLSMTGEPVPDVRRAVARLGLRVTHNLVSYLIMHNVFGVRSRRLHNRIKQLWLHSCRVAAISQVLARVSPGLNPERCLLAGLLHDIGVLPILVYADAYPSRMDALQRLDEVIGDLRGKLGRQILMQWNFAEDLLAVPLTAEDWAREHEGPADYGDLVQVAQVHSYFGGQEGHLGLQLSQLPAFNKLGLSRFGPRAGIEFLEQAQADINVTVGLLAG